MAELPLARDFAAADEAAWRALVEEALRGAPLSSLRSKSYDGIVIEPLYARASAARVLPGRAPGTPWAVMQRIDLPDPAAANAQILDDLNNGATGLTLVFTGACGNYGFALNATEESITQMLDGVQLDAGIVIDLEISPETKDVALVLARLVKARGLAPEAVNIRFGFDPLGAIARAGASLLPWPELAPIFSGFVADFAGQGFAGPFAAADGRPVHAAGGSEAQELAFALSVAVAYLRALEQGGVKLDDARRFIYFRLAADQDQFLTIAKFRALRKLWARIEDACGLAPRPTFITAETAWRMMTKRDPHGNIVRGTIAALAAAIGGADAITVLPFSTALGLPDAFARRIARNTQTILIEEANLYRVADPATGSGAIEALTDALCGTAWWFFQNIEQRGGAAAALETSLIQRAVARVRAEREANVANRKDSLIGVSDFPDLAEDTVNVLEETASSPPQASGARFEPLMRARLAEPFETLRSRSDAYLAKHGKRPKVFLACLGRPSDFNARASFAKSLFEAGGFEAIAATLPLPVGGRSTPKASGEGERTSATGSNPSPGPSPAAPDRPLPMGEVKSALIQAFRNSGAKLACLCSSDKVYARDAAPAARALKQAGAKRVYLAGKPGADRGALQEAGIGTFLHQGCDTLAILDQAYDRL